MDWLIFLVIGILVGSIFTWFTITLRTSWKRGKDLRSSVVKTRKEQQEKAIKAKLDAKKARKEILNFGMLVVLVVIAGLIVAMLFWYFAF